MTTKKKVTTDATVAEVEVIETTPTIEVTIETPEKRKPGRPIVQGSVIQQTLQEKQERLMSGNYIGKGRPIKIESARQQRLQERLSKIANGIEIKRGRPKMVKQEVVEVKQEVVEA